MKRHPVLKLFDMHRITQLFHAGFSSLDIALLHGYTDKNSFKVDIEKQEGKSLIHIIRDLDQSIGPLLAVDIEMCKNRIYAIKDEITKSETLWEQVENCAKCQMTVEDICNYVKMDLMGLNKRCKKDNKCTVEELVSHFKIKGKKRLLEAQFDAANNGSDRMLAHLGENYIEEQKPVVKDINVQINNDNRKVVVLPHAPSIEQLIEQQKAKQIANNG